MSKLGRIAAAAGLAMLTFVGMGEAKYHSTEDAGAEIMDYFENRHRTEREERLTPNQVDLTAAVAKMRAELRQPPAAGKQQPLAIEGDDLYYDQTTGDVYAKGNVRVTELDGRRFFGNVVAGNLNAQTVQVEESGTFVNVGNAQPNADLIGYRLVYNYGAKTGHLESADGKVGHYHVGGKRIELYPDKVLVYDGYQTKCSAKKPDYRVTGDFIEIYPQKQAIVHRARVWIKDKVVYSRDIMKSDISEEAKDDMLMPRVGYDTDDGVSIRYRLAVPLAKNVEAFAHLRYYSKHGMRNIYGAQWENAGSHLSLEYGRYEDSDNRWIRKKPTLLYSYSNNISPLNVHYTVGYERGRWSKGSLKSVHTEYYVDLNADPVYLGGKSTWLNLDGGYSITDESFSGNTVRGFNYEASLVHEFGRRFAVYGGYSYESSTTQNNLFDFNLDDYPKKYVAGFTAELTPRDRVLMATEWNANTSGLRDVDYYWFHDMHCATMIVKYRAKRETWHVALQFTPW